MDATSIAPVGCETRDRLREFKHERELPNYDSAITALLEEVER